jgi:hypothetical protein
MKKNIQPVYQEKNETPIHKALFGIHNQPVKNNQGKEVSNSIYMRGRVVCEEDLRFYLQIDHLASLGVDVSEYGLLSVLLSDAYSTEIPKHGLRGEILELSRPNVKPTDTQNIVIGNPQTMESEK